MNPTPTVPLGGQESFWCETQNESGHKYRQLLTYMNEYEMGLSDDCDNAPLDNVRYDEAQDTWFWTGWFEPSCEHCETLWLFHGKVLRWLPLPQFDAPAKHADTVRLDWLERKHDESDGEHYLVECSITHNGNTGAPPGFPATRAAIDAAMEEGL